MKFTKEHHKSLIHQIEENGLRRADFHFRKKKGRIITISELSPASFSYFLDDSMVIDTKTGAFYRKSEWQIEMDHDDMFIVENWEMVIYHFNEWLNRFHSNHSSS